MSKELIVKHNKLIEANYKLTLQEQKLILVLSAAIEKEDRDFKKCIFSVTELAERLVLDKRAYYTELKEITEKLISKVIKIKEPNGLLQMSWLSSAQYYDNTGKVELSFDEKLKPYLLQLSSHFTKLELKKLVSLNSIYAVRIYELLKQYEKLEERTFEIEELRKTLGIEKTKHKKYNDFKREVLIRAEREINEKTDLNVSFEEIKTSRRITSIKFKIERQAAEEPIQEIEKVEIVKSKNKVENSVEYSDDVLNLFDLLLDSERVESRKKEIAELLKEHTFNYLKSDIEYCNEQRPEKYWSYFVKSVNSGHFSAVEIEKAEKVKEQKKEKEQREIKEIERQEMEKEQINELAEQVYNALTEEMLEEYTEKSGYRKLPEKFRKNFNLKNMIIVLIKKELEEEMKEATA